MATGVPFSAISSRGRAPHTPPRLRLERAAARSAPTRYEEAIEDFDHLGRLGRDAAADELEPLKAGQRS